MEAYCDDCGHGISLSDHNYCSDCYNKMDARILDLENKIEELESEISDLEGEVAGLEDQNEDLREQLDGKEC